MKTTLIVLAVIFGLLVGCKAPEFTKEEYIEKCNRLGGHLGRLVEREQNVPFVIMQLAASVPERVRAQAARFGGTTGNTALCYSLPPVYINCALDANSYQELRTCDKHLSREGT